VLRLENTVGVEDGPEGSEPLSLLPPAPNPSTGATTLRFTLDAGADVRLAVYDVAGREVALLASGELLAGHHEVVFDGSRLPAGVYLVRLQTGTAVATRRLTLVR
jgi:hypothetical protein